MWRNLSSPAAQMISVEHQIQKQCFQYFILKSTDFPFHCEFAFNIERVLVVTFWLTELTKAPHSPFTHSPCIACLYNVNIRIIRNS